MATNLPFCVFIQFLEKLLKFLANFTLKYVKSQRSCLFNHKKLIFGFQNFGFKSSLLRLLKGAIFVFASIKWQNAELETDECDFLRRLLVCFHLVFFLCPRVNEKNGAILVARFLDSEDSGGLPLGILPLPTC